MSYPIEYSTPNINIHYFHEQLEGLELGFQIYRFKDSFMIWIGTDLSFTDMKMANLARFDEEPLLHHLVNYDYQSMSALLSQKLAKKTKKQVFVTCNIPDDKNIKEFVEKRLFEELNNNPQYFYV